MKISAVKRNHAQAYKGHKLTDEKWIVAAAFADRRVRAGLKPGFFTGMGSHLDTVFHEQSNDVPEVTKQLANKMNELFREGKMNEGAINELVKRGFQRAACLTYVRMDSVEAFNAILESKPRVLAALREDKFDFDLARSLLEEDGGLTHEKVALVNEALKDKYFEESRKDKPYLTEEEIEEEWQATIRGSAVKAQNIREERKRIKEEAAGEHDGSTVFSGGHKAAPPPKQGSGLAALWATPVKPATGSATFWEATSFAADECVNVSPGRTVPKSRRQMRKAAAEGDCMDVDVPLEYWSCQTCTFKNLGDTFECQMCEAVRDHGGERAAVQSTKEGAASCSASGPPRSFGGRASSSLKLRNTSSFGASAAFGSSGLNEAPSSSSFGGGVAFGSSGLNNPPSPSSFDTPSSSPSFGGGVAFGSSRLSKQQQQQQRSSHSASGPPRSSFGGRASWSLSSASNRGTKTPMSSGASVAFGSFKLRNTSSFGASAAFGSSGLNEVPSSSSFGGGVAFGSSGLDNTPSSSLFDTPSSSSSFGGGVAFGSSRLSKQQQQQQQRSSSASKPQSAPFAFGKRPSSGFGLSSKEQGLSSGRKPPPRLVGAGGSTTETAIDLSSDSPQRKTSFAGGPGAGGSRLAEMAANGADPKPSQRTNELATIGIGHNHEYEPIPFTREMSMDKLSIAMVQHAVASMTYSAEDRSAVARETSAKLQWAWDNNNHARTASQTPQEFTAAVANTYKNYEGVPEFMAKVAECLPKQAGVTLMGPQLNPTPKVSELMEKQAGVELLGGYGMNGAPGGPPADIRTERGMELVLSQVKADMKDPSLSGPLSAELAKLDTDPNLEKAADELARVVPPARASAQTLTMDDLLTGEGQTALSLGQLTLENIYSKELSGRIAVSAGSSRHGESMILIALGWVRQPFKPRSEADISHSTWIMLELGKTETIRAKLGSGSLVHGHLDGQPHTSTRYSGMAMPTDDIFTSSSRLVTYFNCPKPDGAAGGFKAERLYWETEQGELFSPDEFKELENVFWALGDRRYAAEEREERERKAKERRSRAAANRGNRSRAGSRSDGRTGGRTGGGRGRAAGGRGSSRATGSRGGAAGSRGAAKQSNDSLFVFFNADEHEEEDTNIDDLL